MARQLSVIMPYCNEYPQIYFTVCGIRCELEQSDIDWEIITIANKSSDQGFEKMQRIQTDRIKALRYDEKLSHWCAKNHGIQNSTGETLFFIDGHCILSKNALVNQYKCFIEHAEELHGTLHLPILYMNEKGGRELEYKLQANITEKKGIDNPKNTAHNLHYSFTRYKHTKPFHRVSCMSTCGMMISRKLLVDEMGLWPGAMGIYGGGENFINFTIAVMDYHINVFHRPNSVHHYAEKRGYAQPLTAKIKTPEGWIPMGEMQIGTIVSTPNKKKAAVIEIYPQGIKDVYKVILEDGSTTACSQDHLWQVYSGHVLTLAQLQNNLKAGIVDYIPVFTNKDLVFKQLKTIDYIGEAECQCILIDHPDHLYITDDDIVTHNSWNYDDWVRNRIIAAYMYGGEEWAHPFALNIRGRKEVLEGIYQEVVKTCKTHQDHIEAQVKLSPQEWVEREAEEGRFQGVYK